MVYFKRKKIEDCNEGNDALEATETLMLLNVTSETRKSEYAAPGYEEGSDNKYFDSIFRLL